MGKTKKRDPLYDTFRGLLIWCIPISHFTRQAGAFSLDTFGGVVYVIINVFVMQAFMFLAGYFSKNVDRSRETAFKSLLWPYILSIFFFYEVRLILWGSATLYFRQPPFAMWFLLALFFYKMFIKDLIKIPHVLWISVGLYLVAGGMPFLTEFMATGRIVSYLPFFILGYYTKPEHIERIKEIKKWKAISMGIALIGVAVILAYKVSAINYVWYLLRSPASSNGVSLSMDMAMRLLLLILGAAWMVVLFNLLPRKNIYLSYVGRNTMPVYIFHLVIRQWMKGSDGISLGLFNAPEGNSIVYYLLIFSLASLCVVVLSSKPVVKFYDFVVDGSYDLLISNPIKFFKKIKKRYFKGCS